MKLNLRLGLLLLGLATAHPALANDEILITSSGEGVSLYRNFLYAGTINRNTGEPGGLKLINGQIYHSRPEQGTRILFNNGRFGSTLGQSAQINAFTIQERAAAGFYALDLGIPGSGPAAQPIVQFNPGFSVLTPLGTPNEIPGQPLSLATLSNNNLVVNTFNGPVFELNGSGELIGEWGDTSVLNNGAFGLCESGDGSSLIFTIAGNGFAGLFGKAGGSFLARYGGSGAVGELGSPVDCTASANFLYFADFDFQSGDVRLLQHNPFLDAVVDALVGLEGPGEANNLANLGGLLSLAAGDTYFDPFTYANAPAAGLSGDPFTTHRGELFFYSPVLLALGGPANVLLQFYYASDLRLDGRITSPVGHNFLHNYSYAFNQEGDSATVVTNRGRVVEFAEAGGQWGLSGNRRDVPFQLAETPSGFEFLDPRTGLVSTFENNLLTHQRNGRGAVVTFTYDGNDQLDTVNDGLGRQLSFTYQDNLLMQVSDGTRVVTFGHQGSDLTSITDAGGNTTHYAYAAPGFISTETSPNGDVVLTHIWGAGHIISQTDGAGSVLGLELGFPDSTLTLPDGSTVTHSHDDNSNLTAHTDSTGSTRIFDFDSLDRLTRAQDQLGNERLFGYDAASGLYNHRDIGGGTTLQFTYAPRPDGDLTYFDVISAQFPNGTTTYGYDALGNPNQRVDALGSTWSTTHNSSGQVLSSINPLGNVSTFTYDPRGNLVTFTDPLDEDVDFTYDALDRLTGVTFPDGNGIGAQYDANNRLTELTNENGQTIRYSYDANGNLIQATDRQGRDYSATYDNLNRLVTVVDPRGETWQYSYSDFGRLETTTDPTGQTRTFTYDHLGLPVSRTDGSNQSVNLTRNAAGRVASVIDGEGNAFTLTSDAQGNYTGLTTPTGDAFLFNRDGQGNLVQLTRPLGAPINYTRDALSRMLSREIDGNTESFSYDAAGQLESHTDENGNVTRYNYDNLGRESQVETAAGGVYTYNRNARGWIESFAASDGGEPITVAQTFDATGRVTSRTYSDGTTYTYTYDASGRLLTTEDVVIAYDEVGNVTSYNEVGYTYDGADRCESVTLPSGLVINYTYDDAGNLATLADSQGRVTTYTYDLNGNRIERVRPNGLVTTYQYDDSGRTVSLVESQNGVERARKSVFYDENGRPVEVDRSGEFERVSAQTVDNFTFDYSAYDRITGRQYDALGRELSGGVFTYEWSGLNRLQRATRTGSQPNSGAGPRAEPRPGARPAFEGDVIEFEYNGVDQPNRVIADGVATDILWGRFGIWRLGDIEIVGTCGGDIEYVVDQTASASYFSFDAFEDLSFVTDADGDVIARQTNAGISLNIITKSGDNRFSPFTRNSRNSLYIEIAGLFHFPTGFIEGATNRAISTDSWRKTEDWGHVSGPAGSESPDDFYRAVAEQVTRTTNVFLDTGIDPSFVPESDQARFFAGIVDDPFLDIPDELLYRDSRFGQTDLANAGRNTFAGYNVEAIALSSPSELFGDAKSVQRVLNHIRTQQTIAAAGDPQAGGGFPNGRRLKDDVIDTVVTIINNFEPVTPNGSVDRVERDERRFESEFPFLAPPATPQPGSEILGQAR